MAGTSGATMRSEKHGAALTKAIEQARLAATDIGVRRIRAATLILERAIKLQLSTPPNRTGRLYGGTASERATGKRQRRNRGGARPLHQASAPGESPAPDTGNLRNSVRSELDPTERRADVIVEAQYARWLEFGTPRMAPRPFVRPAILAMRETLAALRVSGTIDDPLAGTDAP